MLTLLLPHTAVAAPVSDPFRAPLPDESALDVFLGHVDPPIPDLSLHDDVAASRVKYSGDVKTSDLPPGPCTPLDAALPPGPCFQPDLTFDDGSVVGVAVTVQSEGGEIDPGSLVGFIPQPEPPDDFPITVSFDVAAYTRDEAALQVGVAVLRDKGVAPLE